MSRWAASALAIGLALLGLVLAALPRAAADRAPARAGDPAREVDARAERCGACHSATYARWRDSMHAASYTDPFFQAGYQIEPAPFCVGCHAPRAPLDGAPEGHAAADGVDCASCHLSEGRVLALHVTAAGEAAHPMRHAPELGDERACAGCHEFRFPALGPSAAFSPEADMQRTVSEWRSHGSTASCQSCHMPEGDHRVLGLRDDAFVRSALDVEVRAWRVGAGTTVRFAMTVAAAGHAVPTGDVLRQLELRAWPEGREDEAVRVELGRRFGPQEGVLGAAPLVERADLRVLPGARRVHALALPGRASRVRYRVDLLRVDAGHAAQQGVSLEHARVPMAAGFVDVARR